jgi:hypothetical protein
MDGEVAVRLGYARGMAGLVSADGAQQLRGSRPAEVRVDCGPALLLHQSETRPRRR